MALTKFQWDNHGAKKVAISGADGIVYILDIGAASHDWLWNIGVIDSPSWKG